MSWVALGCVGLRWVAWVKTRTSILSMVFSEATVCSWRGGDTFAFEASSHRDGGLARTLLAWGSEAPPSSPTPPPRPLLAAALVATLAVKRADLMAGR